MDKSKFGERQSEGLNLQYENGQSDAEKLMSRHLQTDEGSVPDGVLKNIDVTPDRASSKAATDKIASNDSDETPPITPYDILES